MITRLVWFWSFWVSVSAYSIGDKVDTLVHYDDHETSALRPQMPKFGLESTVDFHLKDDVDTFSLWFEDGLRGIPVYRLHRGSSSTREVLESLTIEFVHSDSEIHAVSAKPVYAEKDDRGLLRVSYKWSAEPTVNVEAGKGIMMLCVVLVSLYIIFQVSGLMELEPPPGVKYQKDRQYMQKKW